ncbi:6-hydroxymethylpterin diphosphokinase MptE-like protein [Niveispirillum sp. KHB5.9]|uniref:6-hydroxymethylpterin diphosphokinase MptE-like protein n=1 Tax=Niveispirillum sp. KHB5.9 TaxID=3400269 RepID=UPI003A84E384
MQSVERNDEALEQRYQSVVTRLPLRSPIFLPTARMPPAERLAGVEAVEDLYRHRLDSLYKPKLKALRQAWQGRKRCFVIGNGPSLNQTDLSLLKGEVTFAVNSFFLKAPELDWLPTFYVVEDHLVAEDRREQIEAFRGPVRLFPAYLRYCLAEGDDTIFFDHRPRKSYPHGFDFSTDASDFTYAGCTVTFTCLQLAYFLGFEEIYLIGVDANYVLPADVQQSDKYGVGILDMGSDDPNHFHPDYFGKGYRWHDPQVDKMIQAYGEAERVVRGTGTRIYNATVGGKLEVFERRPFASLFVSPHQDRQQV